MGGRRAISAKMIDNQSHKKAEEEIEARLDAEPLCQSQKFEVPEELTSEEATKWNEIVNLIRETYNSPNSDADKDTMINYCKAWCRFIKCDKSYQDNPNDKDNYRQMMDNAKLINSLKGDLMLSPTDRARHGIVVANAKKKERQLDAIFNRKGDE